MEMMSYQYLFLPCQKKNLFVSKRCLYMNFKLVICRKIHLYFSETSIFNKRYHILHLEYLKFSTSISSLKRSRWWQRSCFGMLLVKITIYIQLVNMSKQIIQKYICSNAIPTISQRMCPLKWCNFNFIFKIFYFFNI